MRNSVDHMTVETNLDTQAKIIESTDIADIRHLLISHNFQFVENNQYLHVGEIPFKEGWILHISVIRIQFEELVNKVIPLLAKEKIAFSIVRDKTTLKHNLDGALGSTQIGKLICIYPQQNDQLILLAKSLVAITSHFRGPAISTDRSLGGCVYSSYVYLEEHNSKQVIGPYPNKYQNKWPFSDLIPFKVPEKQLLLNYKYKPLVTIKPDFKGRVIQANYFKSFFNIKLCIIKEGKQNMCSDELGRDIVDRLKWQYELYKDLEGFVPTPHIFDIFQEQENTYLIMEFIKGDPFNKLIPSVYNGNSWSQLESSKQILLIDLFLKVLAAIYALHNQGYVHRDITPANFIIDKNKNIFLIDMELTYSIKTHRPDPPFRLGTPGYMSPEQMARNTSTPTIKEDIYALGALMIVVLTGMSPIKFEKSKERVLIAQLSSFIEDAALVDLIVRCLARNPEHRPPLLTISEGLSRFREKINSPCSSSTQKPELRHSDSQGINTSVSHALQILDDSRIISQEGIWTSQKDEIPSSSTAFHERIPKPGFQTGIAGILFLLARAQRWGYNIDKYLTIYKRNYNFIASTLTIAPNHIEQGLFNGLSGIAVAISEGIRSRLLTIDSKILENCFPLESRSLDLNMASGLAGQGMALLKCKEYLSPLFFEARIEQILDTILSKQQKDGSWDYSYSHNRKADTHFGLATGTAGIISFLILYSHNCKTIGVVESIQKGLNWLIKIVNKKQDQYNWFISKKNKSINNLSFAIGTPGITLTFIKAYSLLGDPLYKKVAEMSLHPLPNEPVDSDFSQLHGLSGLGEIYIDAYRAFNSEEWKKRADWITKVFCNTFLIENEGTRYWPINELPDLEGDLMTGVSGIIHFLLRAGKPGADLGHILVS